MTDKKIRKKHTRLLKQQETTMKKQIKKLDGRLLPQKVKKKTVRSKQTFTTDFK